MGPMCLLDEVGVDVADFIFGELALFPGRIHHDLDVRGDARRGPGVAQKRSQPRILLLRKWR